jgi:hypothetical protein
MNTTFAIKRTIRLWFATSAWIAASHVQAIVATVTPGTTLTPITNTGSVNFTYTAAAGSVSEQSTQALLCTSVFAASQVGGAFPSGPTPFTPNSFCLNTQAAAPGTGTVNLAGTTPGGETFTMTPAAFTGLYDAVGGYATVYFVRDWFDNLGLQTFTVSRLQLVPTLIAAADNLSVVAGNSVDVLANDFIDVLNASATNVVLSIVNDGGITGLSVASAQLLVPANANGGSYNVVYRICDAAPGGASNCASGNATINVTAAAFPQPDSATVPSTVISNVTVLTNDRIGSTVATTANATITLVAPLAIAGLSVNGSGQIVVPPASPNNYVINYQLCNAAAPTVCASATLNLTVAAPVLVANTDSVTLPPTGGIANVLGNDTIDGVAATSANVATTIQNNGGMVGLSVNGTGAIVVPANTVGAYPVAYRICSVAVPASCANGTANITISLGISASPDVASVPNTGGDVVVLANDLVSGVPATVQNVSLTITNANGLGGLTVTGIGRIRVPPNNVPGTYVVGYRICSIATPAACSTSTATIVVAVPNLVALPETVALPNTGGRVAVLDNDSYNGVPATLSNVSIAITSAGTLTGLTIDATGAILVPSATAGSYSVGYRICALAPSTSICANAVATLVVSPPSLSLATDKLAVPDTGGVLRVLANDLVAGVAATATNSIVSVTNNGGLTGLSVNTNGELVVPVVEGGTYTVTYRVCARTAPTTCAESTAVVTVSVTTLALSAVDDIVISGPLGSTFNVLSNDTLAGKPAPENKVILSLVNNGNLAELTLASTGVLTIPSASPGVYVANYRLCQKNLAANCKDAKVRITVTQNQVRVDGGVRQPPSVPGAASATYTLASGSNSPIIFSQPVPASAGAANSPLILGETRLGYGTTAATGRFQSYRSDSAFEPFGAQFQYSGTGSINYRWEVVRPGEPNPEAVDLYPEPSLSFADRARQTRYSEVSRGQVFLPAIGRYFLRGPDPALLPRTSEGNYLILLRIEASTASVNGGINGASAFPIQPLTYVIVGDRGVTTAPPETSDANTAAAAQRRRLTGGSSVAEFSNMGQLPDAGPVLGNGALRFRPMSEAWKSLAPKTIENLAAHSQAGKATILSWKAAADVALYRIIIESTNPAAPGRLVIVAKPGAEGGYALNPSVLEAIEAADSARTLRVQIVAYSSVNKVVAASDWLALQR